MSCAPSEIKQGRLFWLRNSEGSYPHIQELYPYLKGGLAMVVKVSCHELIRSSNQKKATVNLVDFLYSGDVYSEGVENFCEKASYIKERTYHENTKLSSITKSILKGN